ncbi:MFS transporter (macronuclear) [Tetrahymena thermophila SB210]|uniref:Hexose transporter 1 n=1 Tax=Tetrahymena thermophila (strain SB210) TaxID=312017 RepID=I7M5Y9_TETTS|nr:MFS transporter [Tetrahymena thermophila SB210]EAR83833.1 MFS transporter [Tetrahymena thermophila SB210]|eukprot:XP_001031496.1 MFS transporter [Tetrahymena thermophila SB210]
MEKDFKQEQAQSKSTDNSMQSAQEQNQQQYLSFWHILSNVLVSNLGILYFGYQISVMSLAQNTVFVVYSLKESQYNFYSSLLSAAIPFGAIFGAIIPGSLLLHSSRKNSMIFSDIIATIFAFLSLYDDINVLLLTRFLAGFILGLNSSLVLKYTNEITPISLTGIMGIVYSIAITFGILIASINGQFFSENPNKEDKYIYFVLLFPIVFTISRPILLLVFFNHDTPFYYIVSNQSEKCREFLMQIYKPQYVDQILQEVQQEAAKQGIQEKAQTQNSKPFFVGCVLQIIQQFSGINAVLMYLGQIFQKEHFSFRMTNLLTLASNFIFLISAFLSYFFVEKYSRRGILMSGSTLSGIFLLSLAILYIIDNQQLQFLQFILISCYYVAFNFSLGPVIWLYCSEILQSKEFSIATSINWICATIVVVSIPYFDKLWPLFIFFSLVCFFCTIFTLLIVKETKDKSKIEIINLYNPHQSDLQGEYQSINKNTPDSVSYVD